MKLQKAIKFSKVPAACQFYNKAGDQLFSAKREPVRFKTYLAQKKLIENLAVLVQQNAGLETLQDAIWSALVTFQNYPFHTSKGLDYHYYIKGNEIFFSRKDKSITRATVNLAIVKAIELERVITGPKKLGCFGASYLYPVLIRIRFIQKR